ncbi:uncharacterized protein MAM_05032 [Metarhizium album ARSEF 1941]|uniref:Uncharacterized protein n=1 Tax=Metarhizium album (strain ARSEF 1941) TaxID=1081103 RepID=A0A0B2WSC0_METAS|nr:uncharacterized protein MAM_05032 [Metarhizium album ARSEF 1941]KHN96923.1 hypothetical protein MAM_05032 [Metarhizium album ARSEF 1941]
MLHLKLVTLVLVRVATCLSLPRQYVRPNACCFTLHDSSTDETVRQQTRHGLLYVGGSQPTGWYCIDLSGAKKVLWDAFNNACFVNPDKEVRCLDPIPSGDSWGMKQSGDDVLVTVNGAHFISVR